MQLDEYIKETLVQIAKGVKDASEEVETLGGIVNPASVDTEYQACNGSHISSQKFKIRPDKQTIKFDIALQVKESSGVDTSAKAKLAVLSIGGGAKSHDESHTAHRVQFEIPVDLPTKLDE
ncbi:hypothetical protein [Shewanella pealeana]|nr:hypothetical protein [Shewanella pealeana]